MPGKRINLLPRLGGTIMLAATAPLAAIGLPLWLAAIPFGAARGSITSRGGKRTWPRVWISAAAP